MENTALNSSREITKRAEKNITGEELKIFKKVITQIIENIK